MFKSKIYFALFILILLGQSCNKEKRLGQGDGVDNNGIEWMVRIDKNASDEKITHSDLASSLDGNAIILASDYSNNITGSATEKYNIHIEKIGSEGIIWEKTFGNSNTFRTGFKILSNQDGGHTIGGYTWQQFS